MDLLYHASAFKQDELKPGFQHSGNKVMWDQTESNIWLYATTLRDEAISMGFASAVEKKYDVIRYKTDGKKIHFGHAQGADLSIDKVLDVTVYLYTIQYDKKDGWEKVNNKFNGMDQEYKTTRMIKKNILKREEINLDEWVKDKHITFAQESLPLPLFAKW